MKIEELYQEFLKSSGVSTDTRKIENGCLFFALKGQSFDGNEFAKKALDQGALLSIIDDPKYSGENCVLVDDVLKCLQDLAYYHRKTFDIPFIGITGTNGKTTTKELMAAVLSTTYKTHATVGNFNNHIGVPLTILSMPMDTELAIIEMGANKPGDIKELCDIADPSHGIITNIGKAHLEGFGSFEGVARTKSELYYHLLENNGVVFVNASSEHLMRMASRLKDPVLFLKEGSYYNAELVGASPYVKLKSDSGDSINSQLVGAYNFENIVAALCIGRYLGVTEENAKRAVQDYKPSNNRSEIRSIGDMTVILDAYNANPTSLSAAINSFIEYASNNKLMIIGDMFELGHESDKEHKLIIEKCNQSDIDTIFCGANFYKNSTGNNKFFNSRDDLVGYLQSNQIDAKAILIKGSRGIGLEKVLDAL